MEFLQRQEVLGAEMLARAESRESLNPELSGSSPRASPALARMMTSGGMRSPGPRPFGASAAAPQSPANVASPLARPTHGMMQGQADASASTFQVTRVVCACAT